MPVQEKIKSVAPVGARGFVRFSTLRNFWRKISVASGEPANVTPVSPGRDFGNHSWPAELQGVLAALAGVRQRILANTFLRGWLKSWIWILTGLIVAAAFSPKLAWAMILAAVLVVLGATSVIAWMWRTRPTAYGTACRLDSAAGLQDRVSTAVHLSAVEHPDGMILRQRRDAVSRLAQVDPSALFPIRLPAVARQTLVLAVVAAGLLVYRVYYQPPVVALLQSAARSQFVQSILSPIAHAMERDLQKTLALMNTKSDERPDEARRGELTPAADDLWQAGADQKDNTGTGQQETQEANAADAQQDQGSSPMPEGDMRPGDAQQQSAEGGQQSQEGNNGADRMSGDSQQSESNNSESSRQSLSQSLMQALKNMLSNSPSQQSSSPTSQQPPNSQGMPQSGNSRQPGSGETDKKGDSRGSSDTQQKASQNSSNGAGNQQGSKELKKDQAALPVNAVPDRVALESTGFKEQTRMRVDAGTGTAQLPLRGTSPQAVAVTNGAEQENIPARYRLYVQHYFEHTENGQK